MYPIFFFAACGSGGGGGGGDDDADGNPPPPAVAIATVIAANDLGMHCMDREFSVFSTLPPFNVVNCQVVKRDNNGRPYIADDAEVKVFYDAEGDAGGSTNSYSFGKTTFWPKAISSGVTIVMKCHRYESWVIHGLIWGEAG